MVTENDQPFRIEFVNAARAIAAVAHQASLFENAQMLRNCRARNGQTCGEFMNGARRGAQHLEDGQASGVAKGGEAVLYVSIHLR